ncbi:arginine--tRNA ligase [Paenibacillus sp. KN14-4R]|uniref:arginine--tRNA ligase n=1 Tax=Paenibacillus sp. KN14-4R TaxID=3445773 RepID=UPI003FA000ED
MILTQTAKALAAYISLPEEEIRRLLEVPPNPELGDVALPCFQLAKQWKKSPAMIAGELAQTIQIEGMSCFAAGPYLNVVFDRQVAAGQWLSTILEPTFGRSNIGQGKHVIIDMSAPNIAKPIGIGHLRSTMIGNALYQIYKAVGYKVMNVNHIGDWGTQFGKLLVAYFKWVNLDAVKENPIQEYLRLYVQFHEEVEAHPELEDEARAWFHKLESKDEEATALWQGFVKESLTEFNRMYERLNVQFDYVLGESFYNDKMQAVVDELKEKKLLEESDGALVVRLDEEGLPPCMIVKSDGASIYATRDLATAIYRHEQMQGEKMLYVVGGEQSLHFRQVFHVLKKMGYEWADECVHVPFGLMKFEGKKMSTRRGRIVMLEEVLDEAVGQARSIIEAKSASLTDEGKAKVAEAIGVGAIIFNDLKNHRMNEINFSMEDALSFDGETGPYMQYTYARTQSVLNKGYAQSEPLVQDHVKGEFITSDSAWQLLKALTQFPGILEMSAKQQEPSILAKYILVVGQLFNRFYHQERMLVDNIDEKHAKLALVEAASRIIAKGLQLLGLQTPKQI